ncbi:MAG TPA: BlaI/MecI/CopY family transcriptional regulator [Caulobacteraceae bacterium]
MPVEPNETELEVLKAFWRGGSLSAREVQETIGPAQGWTSSTTRTVLERMRAKGLLTRRAVHGVAVYTPAQDKVSVIGGAINRLIRNVLEVKGDLPASAFTGSELLSPEEADALRKLLNDKAPQEENGGG